MLQYRITPQPEFILGYVEGLVTVEAWAAALEKLGRELAQQAGDRLVLDLKGLLGWLGVPERQAVAVLMARHLGRMERVALVIQPAKITGVVQEEAGKHGLMLRVFPDHEEAARWVSA